QITAVGLDLLLEVRLAQLGVVVRVVQVGFFVPLQPSQGGGLAGSSRHDLSNAHRPLRGGQGVSFIVVLAVVRLRAQQDFEGLGDLFIGHAAFSYRGLPPQARPSGRVYPGARLVLRPWSGWAVARALTRAS